MSRSATSVVHLEQILAESILDARCRARSTDELGTSGSRISKGSSFAPSPRRGRRDPTIPTSNAVLSDRPRRIVAPADPDKKGAESRQHGGSLEVSSVPAAAAVVLPAK